MNRLRMLLIGLLLVLAPVAHAEVRLSTAFGSHMVIQQQMPIRVWGWADAGESVTVALAGRSATARAGDDGAWRVELPAMEADGKPYTLTVTAGGKTIELTDVLLGEVWLCSGQSNMEWNVQASLNAQQETAAANHPTIRLFNVPDHVQQDKPQDDARGQWRLCSPRTVPGFTAVGYYFGRALSQELGVPIGLVGTNWGGTCIEPWIPLVGFAQVPELEDCTSSLRQLDAATPEGRAVREQYVQRVEAWVAQAKQDFAAGHEIGSAPVLNLQPKDGETQIYNGMVAGLTPMSVRGVIWYQGESNAGDGLRYEYLTEALVKGWRTAFDNDDLSFYWVQLANFQQPIDTPAGGGWGPLREGQRRALRLPHTGMAVAIDIGDNTDIHPKNKQDVGKRLALWALANDYGREIAYSGPLYKSHTIRGNKVHIAFDHADDGLMVGRKDGLEAAQEVTDGALARFTIRDKAGQWHWAKAEIDGEAVVVCHENVAEPTAVRYGYESNPVGANLYNKQGLPASPFSTTDD